MSASAMKRHIDKIRRLISVAGLTPKDFFLTQPPPPNRKDEAYPGWKVRERNRRRIARHMSRCGISAHDLAPHAPTATAQLDMFPAETFAGPATAPSREAAPGMDHELVGLAIVLPESCPRCGGHDAWIGAGRGPHKASIMCVCGCHLGWLGIEVFNFISATIQQFGRPTEPICVNRQRATAEVKVAHHCQCNERPMQ
jgi:hypothetical protein